MTSVAMSAAISCAEPSVVTVRTLVGPPDGAAENDRRPVRQVTAKQCERFGELPGPRTGDRIVQRNDKARRGGNVEPPLDQLPRLQIVRQRQRAEIVTERSAGPRSHRQHGGDAGNDAEVERTPCLGSGLDRFADRSRHGEHARVAAGHDSNRCAFCGVTKRGLGARAFLAILRPMPRLALARRHAIEVRAIAIQRLGGEQRVGSLLRQIAVIARAEPDHRDPPAHGLLSQPGTSTMAK